MEIQTFDNVFEALADTPRSRLSRRNRRASPAPLRFSRTLMSCRYIERTPVRGAAWGGGARLRVSLREAGLAVTAEVLIASSGSAVTHPRYAPGGLAGQSERDVAISLRSDSRRACAARR
jgi:hypothetical protein